MIKLLESSKKLPGVTPLPSFAREEEKSEMETIRFRKLFRVFSANFILRSNAGNLF